MCSWLTAEPAWADAALELRLSWRGRTPGAVASFGLPLLPGTARDAGQLRVTAAGRPVPAHITEILAEHDARGERVGVRAVRIQIDGAHVPAAGLQLRVEVRPDSAAIAAPARPARPYRDAALSTPSSEEVSTATRALLPAPGGARLVQGPVVRRTLFTGVEPRVLTEYPAGYLARTGILGRQVTAAEVAATPAWAGLRYLSDALLPFTASALYDEAYPLDPAAESVPDPKQAYEGWLYDRCATLLLAHVHVGGVKPLRAALRHCSYYADQIRLDGPDQGIFQGKRERDTKYSHLRGLYAYYALTGDEAARLAGQAIAALWLSEPLFVAPYLSGRTRGPDKLWTERLLGTSLEGLYYGHRLTGERRYLDAARTLVAVAHRHITGDAQVLAQLNPGAPFPPQDCFIHSAAQQAEGDADQPWCSGWMSELLIDPLLRYQEQTGDARVDEIFVRLSRFLRDVGSNYFRGDPLGDRFLAPKVCDDPDDRDDRRMLVPLYGAGLDPRGQRRTFGEFDDYQHCADATALTAAALRALRRRGEFDRPGPIGPFATEGESILQLHHELSHCARRTFELQTRLRRNPAAWTAAQLGRGLSDPARFLREQRIGYPSHNVTPVRRLSWWFNTALEQFRLLQDAGVAIPALSPGRIQPASCADKK